MPDGWIGSGLPLHETPEQKIVVAVSNIVDAEGPSQVEELVRRVAHAWGYNRVGSRIKRAVMDAA